jgi:hypothetical protein
MESSKLRFLQLAIFSICQVLNTASWINFAPIVDKVLFAFEDKTAEDINYLSWIFMVAFVPINFLSIWVIESKGIKASLVLGVIL